MQQRAATLAATTLRTLCHSSSASSASSSIARPLHRTCASLASSSNLISRKSDRSIPAATFTSTASSSFPQPQQPSSSSLAHGLASPGIDANQPPPTTTTTTRSDMWTRERSAPTPQQLLETNQKWITDTDPDLFTTTAKGQKPSIFWLGCCDSRVPAELITGAAPGDLFVHRNIANTFSSKDGSALAALAYAVNALGVSHVVVCGHYGCGGVQAALTSAKARAPQETTSDEGMEAIQQWLSPIRALAVANMRSSKNGHEGHAHPEGEEEAKSFRHLVEQNVCAQVSNVASSSVIKNAWKAGKKITVHGWVYDIATGKIDDLGVGEGSEI